MAQRAVQLLEREVARNMQNILKFYAAEVESLRG